METYQHRRNIPPLTYLKANEITITLDDISPEELFNMFFGSHGSIFETLQRGNIYVHRTRNNHPQFRQQNSFFLQLLPIIIFLSVTFILNFFQSTPQYQFQATRFTTW
ncbi:hypothetical protein HZS_6979 [Henneguya salminicola]|nr:hypothetical protein HZS_6979 [Henneguya salminicola]